MDLLDFLAKMGGGGVVTIHEGSTQGFTGAWELVGRVANQGRVRGKALLVTLSPQKTTAADFRATAITSNRKASEEPRIATLHIGHRKNTKILGFLAAS